MSSVVSFEQEEAEFNFRSVQPYLPPTAQVLEVGSRSAELSRILKEKTGCQTTSLSSFDGQTLPFESRSFDVVLLPYILHLTDEEALVREAWRVARNGGVVIAMEHSVDSFRDRLASVFFHIRRQRATRIKKDGRFRTVEGWQALFQKAGFYVDWTVCLGRHQGRCLWPNSMLYVLSKAGVSVPVSASLERKS